MAFLTIYLLERKDEMNAKFETFKIINLNLENISVEIPKSNEKEVRKVKELKQDHC